MRYKQWYPVQNKALLLNYAIVDHNLLDPLNNPNNGIKSANKQLKDSHSKQIAILDNNNLKPMIHNLTNGLFLISSESSKLCSTEITI